MPIKKRIIVFLMYGFLGAFAENVAIFSGVWHYSKPELMNIPLWLIPLWGLAGIVGVSFYQGLTE